MRIDCNLVLGLGAKGFLLRLAVELLTEHAQRCGLDYVSFGRRRDRDVPVKKAEKNQSRSVVEPERAALINDIVRHLRKLCLKELCLVKVAIVEMQRDQSKTDIVNSVSDDSLGALCAILWRVMRHLISLAEVSRDSITFRPH